jgi:hypothetical protein
MQAFQSLRAISRHPRTLQSDPTDPGRVYTSLSDSQVVARGEVLLSILKYSSLAQWHPGELITGRILIGVWRL